MEPDNLPDQYKDIILEELHKYCETITNYIRELGYNMDLIVPGYRSI